ncbi:MAG TPA: ATP-binding protein [Candidatus Limnocylindrales bacterium]
MRAVDVRTLGRLLGVAVPALAAATALVWLLEEELGVPNASAVYLLAVVATAIGSGTLGAIASAIAGMILYDFLFTQPLHTLVINDPDEWLNLVLLLFVGLVVGQLTALQRSRAEIARAREREARELFRVSRALATRRSTTAVLPEITTILEAATGMDRVWVSLGRDDASERLTAESRPAVVEPADAGQPRRPSATLPHEVLRRMPGDVPAKWVRVHPPTAGRSWLIREQATSYRVRIEFGETVLGSVWGALAHGRAVPDRTATRLLAAAADQIGQALAQDHLAAEARAAEVSRESDALKSALLQSVSHDLRTPLAAIRAAAGSLRPDPGLSDEDRRASADAIEREVSRLDRLVANLLDLSRIEAGALKAQREVFELDDVVGPIVDRLRPRLAAHVLTVELARDPVLADPVFLDEVVTNLLENAAKFTPVGGPIRVSAQDADDPDRVCLTIEDGGPGVPDDAIDRIFDKFYRAPGAGGGGSRPGTGIGLAVVRGLAEAMGAEVHARQSDLGGLAMDVELPRATLPAELAGSTASASPARAGDRSTGAPATPAGDRPAR